MMESKIKTQRRISLLESYLKGLLHFTVLLLIVLWVNFPIISSNFFYPEQPTIYLANQKILSLHDLLNVYLHPQWLHMVIPFFRPSGHFLIYQIIGPLFGWHNLPAFFIVNFIFLTLTGCMLIANYKLLFPTFDVGAYIAFAIYLMHPALSISRFTIMHFEFAYTFFFLLGLYCFQLFVRNNIATMHVNIKIIRFKYFYLIAFTLFFYILATTFKEPAIILGPVLISYFVIALYQQQNLITFVFTLLKNKDIRQIIILLLVATLTLTIYLTLPWPTMTHPARSMVLEYNCGAINELIKAFLGIQSVLFKNGILLAAGLLWRSIVFPNTAFYLIQLSVFVTLIGFLLIYKNKSAALIQHKKSLLFLILSFFLSLILPIAWAVGAPWHLNLSIIFSAMLTGCSVEYLARTYLVNQRYVYLGGVGLALLVANTAIEVNMTNLQAYKEIPGVTFAMSLNRNAILHPPAIKQKLNSTSLIVVEDSQVHNDYSLGNAAYPLFLFLNDKDYSVFAHDQDLYFMKFNLYYSGNLFHWAYLKPELNEEVYPFRVEEMDKIPNEVIYDWLLHYDNIFCLGYTRTASWYDRTELFKRNLLIEKIKRNITIHHYQSMDKVAFNKNVFYKKLLPLPDLKSCQFTCDQDQKCKGFTLRNVGFNHQLCEFHRALNKDNQIACTHCVSFTKT